MKQATILALVAILILAGATLADLLPEDKQLEIIANYMRATDQTVRMGAALSEADLDDRGGEKCGTSVILQFRQNYDRLDRRLVAAMGAEVVPRPDLPLIYQRPDGFTVIHYDVEGDDAVFEAEIDANTNFVPDYVERLAQSADSCYDFMVNKLGYVAPLSDSTCPDGGNGRVDIYVKKLQLQYYGFTVEDSCDGASRQSKASWIAIDNNFEKFPVYEGRSLEAAAVTIAHEMFHTIHYTIDANESPAWFEMTAVWMEEQMYDEIDDYLLYDELFFSDPRLSLLSVENSHQYQAMLFPLFLSEKYGVDIVREIWNLSGSLGQWIPDVLRACDSAISMESQKPAHRQYECTQYEANGTCTDSVLVTQSLASSISEFSVWNYFTGPYAAMAPAGIGYSEAANYAVLPVDVMEVIRQYPDSLRPGDVNPYMSEQNAAVYIRLENLQLFTNDSLLNFWLTPTDTQDITWAMAAIYQDRDNLETHTVRYGIPERMWTRICPDGSQDPSCTGANNFRGRFIQELIGEQWACTDTLIPCTDSMRAISVVPYNSVTIILTPSSLITYDATDDMAYLYDIFNTSGFDSSLVDIPTAIVAPYPNPAVVAEMDGQPLVFEFQMPTDATSYPVYGTAMLLVDLYSVAGEHVRVLTGAFDSEDRVGLHRTGIYQAEWDMKNEVGRFVASGVYLALARLYESSARTSLLAEAKVKVAVIR